MGAHLLTQDREILADGLPIDSAGSDLVHPIISYTASCAPPLFTARDRHSQRSRGCNAAPKALGARPCFQSRGEANRSSTGSFDSLCSAQDDESPSSSFTSANAFVANSKSSRE